MSNGNIKIAIATIRIKKYDSHENVFYTATTFSFVCIKSDTFYSVMSQNEQPPYLTGTHLVARLIRVLKYASGVGIRMLNKIRTIFEIQLYIHISYDESSQEKTRKVDD